MALGEIRIRDLLVAATAAACLSACMGGFPPRKPPNAMFLQEQAALAERAKLKAFDAGQDEIVTAAELAAPPSMPARAPSGGPPGGGMPDGRLSQPVATADARAL